jgi:REP element-mobilizing transposase RayT
VHLLVEMPPTLAVSQLVQALKGVSSHFVNETCNRKRNFAGVTATLR